MWHNYPFEYSGYSAVPSYDPEEMALQKRIVEELEHSFSIFEDPMYVTIMSNAFYFLSSLAFLPLLIFLFFDFVQRNMFI